jgi:hypothetical protein
MTFIVGRGGQVLEKDLGPETTTRVARIESYNPDQSWAPVEE